VRPWYFPLLFSSLLSSALPYSTLLVTLRIRLCMTDIFDDRTHEDKIPTYMCMYLEYMYSLMVRTFGVTPGFFASYMWQLLPVTR